MSYAAHPHEIQGHPTLELETSNGDEPIVITVCGECGQMRSILWLTGDRWYCNQCRAEGVKPPNMYPIG